MTGLSHITAPLFVPANRPDRFEKAAASGTDAVIIDLEDAVPADAKDIARSNVRSGLGVPVLVRVNAAGTPWHEADVAALLGRDVAAIILPKSEAGPELERLGRVSTVPVLALVETARGIADARRIAATPGITRLVFGSVDYSADIGCSHEREALLSARCELVLASRLAGLPAPVDGVTTSLDDAAAVAEDARAARTLGFGGKLCIHPGQVAAVFAGFRPDAKEVAWAERVLASGDGAARLDGAMVDEPVRIRARSILARAQATGDR